MRHRHTNAEVIGETVARAPASEEHAHNHITLPHAPVSKAREGRGNRFEGNELPDHGFDHPAHEQRDHRIAHHAQVPESLWPRARDL